MSVLSREIESYQRALDQYRRESGAYNKRVEAHNAKAKAYTDSFARDEDGNPYVIMVGRQGATREAFDGIGSNRAITDGSITGIYIAGEDGLLKKATLPADFDPRGFELTQAEGSVDGLMMLRRPTDKKVVDRVDNLFKIPDGDGYLWYANPTSDDGPVQLGSGGFGNPWEFSSQQNDDSGQYIATRERSVQSEAPAAWTEEFSVPEPVSPDPTISAIRRMNKPSPVQMERGLIGAVIRGKGTR